MTPADLASTFLLLLATMDPFGTMALFTGLTTSLEPQARRRTATRASLYGGAILLLFIGVVVLTDNREFSVTEQAITAGLMLLALAVCWVFMVQAHRLQRVIGAEGATLLVSVLGLVLAGLAVEMVLESLRALLPLA